jgi:hypothetical protein
MRDDEIVTSSVEKLVSAYAEEDEEEEDMAAAALVLEADKKEAFKLSFL